VSIAAILVAIVAAFLVFRFVAGMIKFVVLAAIVIAVIYFFSQGSF
jgi:hypothetical protein